MAHEVPMRDQEAVVQKSVLAAQWAIFTKQHDSSKQIVTVSEDSLPCDCATAAHCVHAARTHLFIDRILLDYSRSLLPLFESLVLPVFGCKRFFQ